MSDALVEVWCHVCHRGSELFPENIKPIKWVCTPCTKKKQLEYEKELEEEQ